MSTREDRVIDYVIPGLLTVTLTVVGWMAVNINRISENMAVLVYRVETQTTALKEVNHRVKYLEASIPPQIPRGIGSRP